MQPQPHPVAAVPTAPPRPPPHSPLASWPTASVAKMASADASDGLRRRGAAGSVPSALAAAALAAAVDGNGSATSCEPPKTSSAALTVDAEPLPWPLRFPASTARRFGENPFIRRDRPPCLRQYIKVWLSAGVLPWQAILVWVMEFMVCQWRSERRLGDCWLLVVFFYTGHIGAHSPACAIVSAAGVPSVSAHADMFLCGRG